MKVFLAGGFLGSGKTTAIRTAAGLLQKKGTPVAVVTNDQGSKQVDTRFIKYHGIPAEEVAGGCFCCKFQDLEKALETLQQESGPVIVFAEAVGSCTDLAATVVNPLLHRHPLKFDLVLTVFADVLLLCIYLQGEKNIFHGNANYIYGRQLEEADMIVVNKIDLLNDRLLEIAKKLIEKEFGHKKIIYQNSLSEESMQGWMDALFQFAGQRSIRHTPDLDYGRYADGEAGLAWLDMEIEIISPGGNASGIGRELMHHIYGSITQAGYATGHLKCMMEDGERQDKISYTAISGPGWAPDTVYLASNRVILLFNARVQTTPERLYELVSESIRKIGESNGCEIRENSQSFFSPGYPKPTHRIAG